MKDQKLGNDRRVSAIFGGRKFGDLVPGTPEIVSRNLTPDRTGRPVGGRTLAEF